MKKKRFFFNAILLTLTTLLLRIIGILFRVYMSNKIGAEGIGLYQLILTIYMFVATFSSSGISLAVTRLVTDEMTFKRYSKVKVSVRICFIIGVSVGIASGVLLYFFSEFIGTEILKDSRAIFSLKILAPSLPFLAISACYRGYFFAVRKVIKTASEQLIEQICEIAVFSIVIGTMAPKGLEYACGSIVIGTTVAEIISCVYSFVLYSIDIKGLKIKVKARLKDSNILRKILSIAVPVTGSSCLRSGLSMVENILIPKGLKKSGQSYNNALSGYGMLTGMVMPVITFPSAFLMSFSTLIIPEFSEANASNHKKNIRYISGRIFQITFFFSILIMGIFIFFGKELSLLIYSTKSPGIYISVLAPVIPLMYLDSVVDGMLKGLNEQLHYLSYNIIDSVLRVILIFLLLPVLGLNGLIIVIFVSEILNSTLSIARLVKVTNLHMEVSKWIIKPLISVFIPGIFLCLLSEAIDVMITCFVTKVILELAFIIIIYIILLFIMRCLNKDDIKWVIKIIKELR